MDWTQCLQRAINYVEEHIFEQIKYEEIAKNAYCSTFHFQKIFAITFGFTLGEYIRKRRLSLAGKELLNSKLKITDIALKYGYETPESFSRAFYKFHGIVPSKAKKGYSLKYLPPLEIQINITNSKEQNYSKNQLNYTIKELPEKVLVGYKKRFYGSPFGEDRNIQEAKFFNTTRAKQWLLIGASCNYSIDYVIIDNVSEDGYDLYIAYELDEWTRKEIFNSNITGVDFVKKLDFETIIIPKNNYIVFKTEKKKHPILDYTKIREKIVTEQLPTFEYEFSNSPEITIMHWRPKGQWEKERYIEICLPIKSKKSETICNN